MSSVLAILLEFQVHFKVATFIMESSNKPMRNFLVTLTKLILVLITLPIFCLAGLFYYGLVLFPDIHPPTYEAPQAFSEIFWAEAEGVKPIPEKSIGIASVFGEVFDELFGSYNDRLPRDTPISSLANLVAKNAMRDGQRRMKQSEWHLSGFCGSIWIASHWTPYQMLAFLSATQYMGHHYYGIESAAQSYFGLPAESLTPSQMTLLIAIQRNPRHYDPWCAPESALTRVNDFIANLEVNVQPITNLAELKMKPAPDGICEQE